MVSPDLRIYPGFTWAFIDLATERQEEKVRVKGSNSLSFYKPYSGITAQKVR